MLDKVLSCISSSMDLDFCLNSLTDVKEYPKHLMHYFNALGRNEPSRLNQHLSHFSYLLSNDNFFQEHTVADNEIWQRLIYLYSIFKAATNKYPEHASNYKVLYNRFILNHPRKCDIISAAVVFGAEEFIETALAEGLFGIEEIAYIMAISYALKSEDGVGYALELAEKFNLPLQQLNDAYIYHDKASYHNGFKLLSWAIRFSNAAAVEQLLSFGIDTQCNIELYDNYYQMVLNKDALDKNAVYKDTNNKILQLLLNDFSQKKGDTRILEKLLLEANQLKIPEAIEMLTNRNINTFKNMLFFKAKQNITADCVVVSCKL